MVLYVILINWVVNLIAKYLWIYIALNAKNLRMKMDIKHGKSWLLYVFSLGLIALDVDKKVSDCMHCDYHFQT
jgi:hypothetical protein